LPGSTVRVKTIGVTGGIGSGKTTVARILEELGATVIHADTVGHEIYRPNSEGWRRVTQAFGAGILNPDQTVDRKKLGAIVFADPGALERLNSIVHPLIEAEIRRRVEAYRAAGVRQPVVLEAAVLIEADWLPLVDEVWLVSASKDTIIQRVVAERGLQPQEVEARIQAQLSDAERRAHAHLVIENNGSLSDLRGQVVAAWARVRHDRS
jgi:dephospho-CoA kinase